MASANNSREIAVTAVVFAATAVLVWFGNGLTPWWPLTWFAPLPLFWFSLRSPGWATAVLAFTSWLAGSVNMLG
jgi:hypothetical protein